VSGLVGSYFGQSFGGLSARPAAIGSGARFIDSARSFGTFSVLFRSDSCSGSKLGCGASVSCTTTFGTIPSFWIEWPSGV
jgi:hypothetical protein